MTNKILLVLALWMAPWSLRAQDTIPTIQEKIQSWQASPGYFPFYWDAKEGKLWLEIPRLDTEFLYYTTLAAGAGSNDIGLDRGRLGEPQVVEFRRSGPKILLVALNQQYRAVTDDENERAAVAESFAESVLALLPPYPLGYEENARELFPSRTGITFNPMAAAETAADFTLGFLLNPERLTRMVDYHARYDQAPGFLELVDQLTKATWQADRRSGYEGELQRSVQRLILNHFVQLAANEAASGPVRAMATSALIELKEQLSNGSGLNDPWKAHYQFALAQIRRFEDHPAEIEAVSPLPTPDDSPIGQDEMMFVD